jgi:hypothetical protein
LRGRDAGEGNEERAKCLRRGDAAVVAIGFAEGAQDVTDGLPAEDGGEDDQAIDEEEAHPWICARFVSPP